MAYPDWPTAAEADEATWQEVALEWRHAWYVVDREYGKLRNAYLDERTNRTIAEAESIVIYYANLEFQLLGNDLE